MGQQSIFHIFNWHSLVYKSVAYAASYRCAIDLCHQRDNRHPRILRRTIVLFECIFDDIDFRPRVPSGSPGKFVPDSLLCVFRVWSHDNACSKYLLYAPGRERECAAPSITHNCAHAQGTRTAGFFHAFNNNNTSSAIQKDVRHTHLPTIQTKNNVVVVVVVLYNRSFSFFFFFLSREQDLEIDRQRRRGEIFSR